MSRNAISKCIADFVKCWVKSPEAENEEAENWSIPWALKTGMPWRHLLSLVAEFWVWASV